MAILVECSSCDGKFRVDAAHAGKRIRCPACQGVITVPTANEKVPGSRQVPPRSAAAAPQARSNTVSRPNSSASADSRRSRVFEAQGVRQPRDPNRYTQTRVAPWKIMLASAGAVVALGIGGIVLFNLLQGTGSDSEMAQSVPDVESKPSASSGETDSTKTSSTIPETASEKPAPVSATAASTFASGTVPSSTALPIASSGTAPATGSNGTFENPAISSEAVAANSATGQAPVVLPVGPATNADSAPVTAADSMATMNSTVLAVSATDLSIDELFSRVEGSVVRVNVASNEGAGNGSGFVIDAAGIVVTNYHVIAGANRAWVEFANKDRIDVDGLLYVDHMKDIAILKFDAALCSKPISSIPVAQVQPRKGIAVVAIGAPLGLDMSVTEGIVSAVRTATELEESIDLTGHSGTWIQTTAAISPGNSGGPLITKRGEVVAINTLTLVGAGAQALNFGISGEDIRLAMTELEDTPIPLSPLSAPEMRTSDAPGESGRGGIIDASGTPQGDKLLADLRKLVIVFLPLTFNDPQQTVVSAVRSEARQILEKAGIEESLISSDKAALLLLMKLERSGNRLVLYVTAHIIVQDGSSGRPQDVKIWERTGEVGSISQQAILSGNLPINLRKEIKDFFAKLRADILKARKATSGTTN
jgi:S1-C subfamily serine protease